MLPFARFIMQGRNQALGVVFLSLLVGAFFWPGYILAAAALGLVWLRISVRDGVLLWLWALLPAIGLMSYYQDILPLLIICSASAGSYILRKTNSWEYTLVVLTGISVLASLGFDKLAPDITAPYVEAMKPFLEQLQKQLQQSGFDFQLSNPLAITIVAGLLGGMLSVSVFCSLALARSWQAALYNPGGFQLEFHRLRLGKATSLALALMTAGLAGMGIQYMVWAGITFFPMIVAGIALFHAYAMHRKLAMHWYYIFYVVLVLWDPAKVILMGIAFADSFINFRSKLKTNTDY